MIRNTVTNKKAKSSDVYWRRRPSEMKGYNRTFYTTTDDNEYIRVDFNIKDKKIRIYLEDNDEGGNPYYSVITGGKITVERNATTGRVSDLFFKFSKRAGILSTIPNKDVLRLINNNYGLGLTSREKKADNKIIRVEGRRNNQIIAESEISENKYFDPYSDAAKRKTASGGKGKKFYYMDIVDVLIGLALCVFLFLFNHNYVTLGVLSAFIGIFIGLLDIYYRERQIILIKMLFFLLAGIVFYIYGYYIL